MVRRFWPITPVVGSISRQEREMPEYLIECGAAFDVVEDGYDDGDGYVADDHHRTMMFFEWQRYGYRQADTVFRVVGSL